MQVTKSSRFAISNDVHFCAVDSEIVILNPDTGLYFGLNEVASMVWRLISQGSTVGEILSAVTTEFDATVETVWPDLLRLVAELQSHGLVIALTPTDQSSGR